MPKKKPAQLELFAARVSHCSGKEHEELIHALGLLGWRDPLWTRKFTVKLLDGTELPLTLATVRQLKLLARTMEPESLGRISRTPSPSADGARN